MVAVIPFEGKLLPIKDAAGLLSVHPNTLRRWSNQGIIGAYRIGARGDRRFLRGDVFNLLGRLQMHQGSPLED
jgi:excisionase family DNA binding protein